VVAEKAATWAETGIGVLYSQATEAAEKNGAQVRMRKVHELAPESAIAANPAWGQHLRETAEVPQATSGDLA
jgi:NAD(P)H dehydrogenase (quinone)